MAEKKIRLRLTRPVIIGRTAYGPGEIEVSQDIAERLQGRRQVERLAGGSAPAPAPTEPEQTPAGGLPDDFPGRDALLREGLDSIEAVRAYEGAYSDIDGIGAATDEKIRVALEEL